MRIFKLNNLGTTRIGEAHESKQNQNNTYSNISDIFYHNKTQKQFHINTYCVSFGASKEDHLKHRVRRLYDTIYKDMAVYAKEKYNLDFIKPTLKFSKSYEDSGYYTVENNSVTVNILYRGRKKNQVIPINPSNSFVIDDGVHSHSLMYVDYPGNQKIAKHPKRDEQNVVLAETISHELSHAVQAQLGLSDKNAKKALTDVWRKYHPEQNHLNDEDLYEYFTQGHSFIKEFIPQDVYKIKKRIESPDGQIKEISPLDILVSFFIPRNNVWIASIEEIDAERQSAEFNEHYLAKRFPKVHPERINAIIDAEYYNSEVGSKIFFESQEGAKND